MGLLPAFLAGILRILVGPGTDQPNFASSRRGIRPLLLKVNDDGGFEAVVCGRAQAVGER